MSVKYTFSRLELNAKEYEDLQWWCYDALDCDWTVDFVEDDKNYLVVQLPDEKTALIFLMRWGYLKGKYEVL
jgi:hypothetical protein